MTHIAQTTPQPTSAAPLRGFHLRFGSHEEVDALKRVITGALAPMGVNTLILECNTSFVFTSHPEVSGGTLTAQDVQGLTALCREHGIRLIPLFECLGHQGWGGASNSLLRAHPEFDESPHVPQSATWPEIYCRSWCPKHPEVLPLIFDLLDELLEAFEADALHVGLDEVFTLADDACPRCRGEDRAELFATTTRALHDHVVGQRGKEMLMWADRLVDAKGLGYDLWEGDTFGTYRALDKIPTDIILCDWHYERRSAYPSIKVFLERGFTVWPCSWRNPEAALDFLNAAKHDASSLHAEQRLPGMLVTGWNATGRTLRKTLLDEGEPFEDTGSVAEIAQTLKTVMRALGGNRETERKHDGSD